MARDPAAIVGNRDALDATFIQHDAQRAGTRIERIFQQFFDYRGGPFDHLAGGDLADQLVGQGLDRARHKRLAAERRLVELGGCLGFSPSISPSISGIVGRNGNVRGSRFGHATIITTRVDAARFDFALTVSCCGIAVLSRNPVSGL
jgi:hypothetical protein